MREEVTIGTLRNEEGGQVKERKEVENEKYNLGRNMPNVRKVAR
jgi:hypothetical protein